MNAKKELLRGMSLDGQSIRQGDIPRACPWGVPLINWDRWKVATPDVSLGEESPGSKREAQWVTPIRWTKVWRGFPPQSVADPPIILAGELQRRVTGVGRDDAYPSDASHLQDHIAACGCDMKRAISAWSKAE